MFTIKNTVILALMQIGVIVVGVLAAGLGRRFWVDHGLPMPLPAEFLYDYSILWFFIPMAWSMTALMLRVRPEVSDDAKNLVFLTGVLLIITLGGFVIYADVTPWLQFDGVLAAE